eukprot:GFUD01004165.1.p1 GENE.GFUD01004165.1~~GFUD01004165.1.p1  ORF type:complete len:233 (-),score=42.17 GFUD01004165.1:90-788(-)
MNVATVIFLFVMFHVLAAQSDSFDIQCSPDPETKTQMKTMVNSTQLALEEKMDEVKEKIEGKLDHLTGLFEQVLANTACDCEMVVLESRSYGEDDGRCYYFSGTNVLTNQVESRNKNTSNYWLAPKKGVGKQARLHLFLGCTRTIRGFFIKNTHNAHHKNFGTKTFSIYSSSTHNGPWSNLILTGRLSDVRSVQPAPLETFNLPKPITTKFIIFQIDAYYGSGGGLQYISTF